MILQLVLIWKTRMTHCTRSICFRSMLTVFYEIKHGIYNTQYWSFVLRRVCFSCTEHTDPVEVVRVSIYIGFVVSVHCGTFHVACWAISYIAQLFSWHSPSYFTHHRWWLVIFGSPLIILKLDELQLGMRY